MKRKFAGQDLDRCLLWNEVAFSHGIAACWIAGLLVGGSCFSIVVIVCVRVCMRVCKVLEVLGTS